jgi:hypothetical protein
MLISTETSRRAGQMMKVIALARTPGMDSVAVRLNMGLTEAELAEARRWAKAFELAERRDTDIMVLAAELAKEFR